MTTPEVITSPERFRTRCDRARHDGARVGFVPTMGALHAGHLALVTDARRRVGEGGLVAVSVFVNPTQFGPNEDLAKYPRELDADIARCAAEGVDVVFAPHPQAMYPEGDQTRVRVPALAEPMCGVFRPGHFEGVATVVAKLFALTGPCVALFGRKDYQQWKVLSAMARDLFFPVEVVGHPTVREFDGLALSSRNRYLSPDDRARAVAIPRALAGALHAYEAGERDREALRAPVEAAVRAIATSVDYVDVRDAETLTLAPVVLPREARMVVALAVRVGTTRLIDNVVLGEANPLLDLALSG